VVLDGLLFVIGGEIETSIADTVEIYNPNTDTWTMEKFSRNGRIYRSSSSSSSSSSS